MEGRSFGRSYLIDASEVEHDITSRFGAADEEVALSRRLDGFGSVCNAAADQPALTAMADPCPTGPSHGNVASFSEFEKVAKLGIPADVETTPREGHKRPGSLGTGGWVWGAVRGADHTGSAPLD